MNKTWACGLEGWNSGTLWALISIDVVSDMIWFNKISSAARLLLPSNPLHIFLNHFNFCNFEDAPGFLISLITRVVKLLCHPFLYALLPLKAGQLVCKGCWEIGWKTWMMFQCFERWASQMPSEQVWCKYCSNETSKYLKDGEDVRNDRPELSQREGCIPSWIPNKLAKHLSSVLSYLILNRAVRTL